MPAFSLRRSRKQTYVEMEVGMDPTSCGGGVAEPFFGLQYKRWVRAVLDALPAAIDSRYAAA